MVVESPKRPIGLVRKGDEDSTITAATDKLGRRRRSHTAATPVDERPSSLRADLESVWAIGAPDGAGAAADGVLAFAATIVQEAALADDGRDHVREAAEIIAAVSELARVSETATRRALFRGASRRLALLLLEPAATLAAEVRLLVMLAPVVDASIWSSSAGTVKLLAASSPLATTRRCRRAAVSALHDDAAPTFGESRARIRGYGLGVREAALVVRLGGHAYPEAVPFLEDFEFAFRSIGERDRLARAAGRGDGALQQAYERRLVRAAFDLHDGPLQDLAALAAEVRSLRAQVVDISAVPEHLLVGRLDDVTSRIVELDRELRDVMQSLETPTLADRPLLEAVEREASSFMRRCDATVDVTASGSLDELTVSQRIAVVRIVQEALSNVREHSIATHVDVDLHADESGLELRVADNGKGFDLRETAAAAAKRGRLGIVGMTERVRLLGGVFTIDSAPGVGTTVVATIPVWRPLVER